MRLLSALAISALLLLTACFKANPSSWSGATGMEQHERLMWQSLQAGKWDDVSRHMAESFLGSYPDGAAGDRDAAIAHLRQLQVTDVSLGEFEVRPNGADMVVSYVAVLKGTWGGKPVPRLRVISVWQTVRGGWVQISQAMAPMPASPAGP